MKKIFTLLSFLFSFTAITSAQVLTCNAEFSTTYQSCNAIQFNPAMPGEPATTLHYWIFGDGIAQSTVSPLHTYIVNGTYTAKHIIIKHQNGVEICRDSFYRVIQIPGPGCTTTCNLVAGFVFSLIPNTTNSYHFTNTSTQLSTTDSIRWTFGDGTSSNQVNADHTYTQPGNYNVCLRVQKREPNGTLTNCVSEICHTVIVVYPTTCNLVASFVVSPVASAPNYFHFENTSTPLGTTDSIRWTFGDGTSSNQVSPYHSYTAAGTYNVCLRVIKRNSAGTLSNCVSETCHTIVVQTTTTCNLVANFTATIAAGSFNTFHFQNTSVPLAASDSIRWTFGDGSSSNQVSPNHTYTAPGAYNVCLRIIKREPNGTLTNCIREICHTVVVQTITTCNLAANFYSVMVSGAANVYHFVNTSAPLSPSDSIRWTFGDGTSSNQVSPNHTYTAPGTYNVCLRIIKREPNGTLTNCIREICHTVVVGTTNTCNLVANFYATLITTSPNTIPNTFYFINTSAPLSPNDSIRWTFGDGTSSNLVNPTHTYAQPGTYNVCLRIQKREPNGTLTNCIREICHTVTVLSPTSCNMIAGFTFEPVTSAPLTYHFQNTTVPLNPTDSIRWTFGDGTSTNQMNPNHTYAQPGIYNVCLRVQQRNALGTLSNCVREVCHTVVAGTTNACNLQPYPNPASSTVTVNVFLGQPQMIDVYIYNINLLLVTQLHQQGVQGNNIITVPIASLVPGFYTMRVVHGNDICYAHFVKL